MKIVKPNAEYFDHGARSPYQNIEIIGRTCYKSEDAIGPKTCYDFVKKLVGRKHFAMLEHVHLFYIFRNGTPLSQIERLPAFMLKYLNYTPFKDMDGNMNIALSASFTALFNFLQCVNAWTTDEYAEKRKLAEISLDYLDTVEKCLVPELKAQYPEIFDNLNCRLNMNDRFGYKDNPFSVRQTYISLIEDYAADIEQFNLVMRKTMPHTMLFTVDRGVTHELVRHRPASFAQESTRYCNYQKGKFGSEITVVEPAWAMDEKKKDLWPIWEDGCREAEAHYMEMLANGASPQDARSVLPTSVKNDIIITAVEEEWEHITNLRLYAKTGAPHPDMLRVMKIAEPLLHNNSDGRLCPED